MLNKIRFCLLLCFVTCNFYAFTQQLHQVAFSNGESFKSFSFLTDQGIIIRISDDGKLLQWGTEMDNRKLYYTPGKLDEYMGRVDYYGTEADSIFRGKV